MGMCCQTNTFNDNSHDLFKAFCCGIRMNNLNLFSLCIDKPKKLGSKEICLYCHISGQRCVKVLYSRIPLVGSPLCSSLRTASRFTCSSSSTAGALVVTSFLVCTSSGTLSSPLSTTGSFTSSSCGYNCSVFVFKVIKYVKLTGSTGTLVVTALFVGTSSGPFGSSLRTSCGTLDISCRSFGSTGCASSSTCSTCSYVSLVFVFQVSTSTTHQLHRRLCGGVLPDQSLPQPIGTVSL